MKIRTNLLLLTLFAFVACRQTPAPDPAAEAAKKAAETAANHIETLKKMYIAFNAHNVDEFVKYVPDDQIDHAAPPDMQKGKENLRKVFAMLFTAFPDLKYEVEHFATNGDIAMAHGTLSGTHKGDFMGIPPTNKSFSVKDVDILRFDEQGLSAEHWAVQDMCAIFNQLGVTPPAK
ncbi:MAG TPA: ester cyclase [Saprospiraceae bacterium]|nr:ester cyclase [Saprospiraceae bacterium]